MTPEDQARQNIDHQLSECGWILQDMANMNIMAGPGVAVREEFGCGDEFCQKITSNQSKPLDRQPTVSLERVLKEVSKGVVHPDLASTLGAKISRLAGNRSEGWHTDVEKRIDGQPVSHLISTLFDSVDADKNRVLAASKFSVTPDQVTDTQLDEIEAEQVRTALLPFHNPQLREILLRPEHQVIDKFTRDQLLTSSFDPEAKKRAETLVTSFRQFIEDNKDEIEAISILYSRPYATGFRYSQVKNEWRLAG